MKYRDDEYMELTDYESIYRELINQRNTAIRWLNQHGQISRARVVDSEDESELTRHKIAQIYRPLFRRSVLILISRLYYHDAVEAKYDFESVQLGSWSDTEANWLERELQQLQKIITRLEIRYDLQYRLIFEYVCDDRVLLLSGDEVKKYRKGSIKHRLMCAIFSDPYRNWLNIDIEEYFVKHFDYKVDGLPDSKIIKAANDINAEVAQETNVKDLLDPGGSAVKVNQRYLLSR